MLLSKTSEYGIRAMLHLSGLGSDSFVAVRTISKELDISFHFLTKIFQQLARAGLVDSYRGPNGGIRLTKEANSVTVKSIVIALEGDRMFTECVLGLPACGEDHPCPLHDNWKIVREEVNQMLASKSLLGVGEQLRMGEFRLCPDSTWDIANLES